MSAEIISLEDRRRAWRLSEALAALNKRLAAEPLPMPEEIGWAVISRDEAGRPLRVFCPNYRAFAGYVPGAPELVYLEYGHVTRAYALGLEELLAGLETGCLPDPVIEASGPPPR